VTDEGKMFDVDVARRDDGALVYEVALTLTDEQKERMLAVIRGMRCKDIVLVDPAPDEKP
jgi:hypothetical protein